MNDINQEPYNDPHDETEIIPAPVSNHKKKLFKSYQNVVLSGVCGGLAEYFHIHPILVRIIFIILAFLGGWGVVFYVILSLMLPENHVSGKKFFEKIDTKRLFGFLLLFTGAYFFFDFHFFGLFDPFSFTGTIFFPFILAATGIWILVKGGSKFTYTPVIKQKNLYRSNRLRKLLGICGGLAEYMNLDANIIRLFWLLFSIVTLGIGVILYFLLAIFIQPEQNMVQYEE